MIVRGEIELSNALMPEMQAYRAAALVDSSVMNLCIPENLARRLQLKQVEERKVISSNGSAIKVPYAGPLKVSFQNRSCFTGALVFGDEVVLGNIPIQDMDLIIAKEQLVLSPKHVVSMSNVVI